MVISCFLMTPVLVMGVCPSSLLIEFVADDNSYRLFSAAARGTGYGKYGRNTRNFFNHRGGGGGSYWGDHADTFPLPKQQHDLSGQSLFNDLLTYQSHPSSDIDTSSWDHVSFKDQNDKLPAHRGDKQQS